VQIFLSRGANITADYKQLRFISSEKAREWMRETVDGLMIILCIVERAHLSFIVRVGKKEKEQLDILQNLGAHFGELTD